MGNQRWEPFRRRRVGLVVFGLAALATGLLGWRAVVHSRPPNVLLITLDTTRADRLGCYGYALALTPTLDALAAEGVLFERACTPAPLTLPSHASMMTGLYPPEHGLVSNGRGRLDENIPTLAESLRDAGYDTAGFIGSFVLHSKFGLQQGFASYDDDMTNTRPTEHGLHRQRDGVQVVDSALAWLTQRRTKPFFCWVHLYDPHNPYLAHADEFGDRFQDRPYDGEIAYVDRQVQRLVKHLDSNQFRERTLVVVVGDHGENLGEHDEEEHSLTLYDSVLHVPWIWAGYGASAKGRRVPQPVSLVDLRPTILEAVGLRDRGPTSGRSLVAALSGKNIAAGNCYSATDDPLLEHGWSPLRSLTTAGWKYIRSPEVELYDLLSDPQEALNLAAARPEQVQELELQLAALERTMVVRQGEAVNLSTHERRALESLGYARAQDSLYQPVAPGEQLPDVKRMLPLYNEVEAAHKLLFKGDAPAAEKRLRELSDRAPDYTRPRRYLAEALTRQKKLSESREVLQTVLKQDPDNSEAHFQLGVVCWEERQFPEAVKEFRRALVINPNAEGSLFALAQALVQIGQLPEAEQSFRQALDQDPAHVEAHVALGNLLGRQKRTAEAEQHYRQALKYTPGLVEAHDRLAILLAGQQRLDEAGEHFQQAAELSPKNAELQYNYGSCLLLQGRRDEAIRSLEEALRLNPQHLQAKMRLEQARSMRGE
jgi:arylsulfatase A-like enzyme/Tfp pilus assembly protein PilF